MSTAYYKQVTVTFEPYDLLQHYHPNMFNAMKYLLRAPFKGQEKSDYNKALWYLDKELERMASCKIYPGPEVEPKLVEAFRTNAFISKLLSPKGSYSEDSIRATLELITMELRDREYVYHVE